MKYLAIIAIALAIALPSPAYACSDGESSNTSSLETACRVGVIAAGVALVASVIYLASNLGDEEANLVEDDAPDRTNFRFESSVTEEETYLGARLGIEF